MSSSSDKLENCKKEIRSILIPFQRGCMLTEFKKTYKEIIGRGLPAREFGYKNEIDFLQSMPDVVQISYTKTGEYHLFAVPDESSKHILKMVAKQKPAKSKVPARMFRSMKFSYVVPPRFESTVKHSQSTSKEVKYSVHTPYVKDEPPKKEPIKPREKKVQEQPKLPPKASPKEEVIALVQYFNNELALDDLLFEYKRLYQKDIMLSKYGFSSVVECIESIPELSIWKKKNCDIVVFEPKFSDAVDSYEDCNVEDISFASSNKNHPNSVQYSVQLSHEAPSGLHSQYKSTQDNEAILPDSLTRKLQMVAERYSQGIWSAEFPTCFEEITGTTLDIHSLGYRCLSDLIDDVPEIFNRKPVAGSRKDYLIYPVNEPRPAFNAPTSFSNQSVTPSVVDVHYVVVNLRRILEAYSEGIELEEFSTIYGINCKDTLHIRDFGFDDLEAFLISIKDQVPLRIDSSRGVKTIHLLRSNSSMFIKPPELPQNEAIPIDAANPDFEFKPQTLPSDFDYSKYIPVYTSSIAHPGFLYIQLQGEETTDALVNLANRIETFYNDNKSEQYTMKNSHIKVGASCVAKWPADKHWYRATVINVISSERVLVHYVDYGTRDTIPTNLLRYIKKEFSYLPAQALRCRLAFLKPPNNAMKWDIESRSRILSLCEDIPLMAKIQEIGIDGIYSILLCDTNGKEDVYINDVLCNERLAVVGSDNAETPPLGSKTAVPLEYNYNLTPMQAWQAQCFLQAFVTIAPCFAQNENYLNLMKQVTTYCTNSEGAQNIGLPAGLSPPIVPPSLGPPGFKTLPPNMQTFGNSNFLPNAYYNSYLTSSANASEKFVASLPTASSMHADFNSPYPPPPAPFSPIPASDGITLPKSLASSEEKDEDDESEIFYEDDDDEMFQQICRKVNTNIRHVKRVLLGDGYKIHIIVVESKPHASCGDISQLIWNNKEPDYLNRRLQLKEVDIPCINLTADGNEDLFEQLERLNVRGIQKVTGFKDSILLYPLNAVIKILNIFGHPSVTLRTKLTEEIASFNLIDPEWMNFSPPEPLEPEEEENSSGATDDDKIEKLCLFDLLAMKESITLRRKKLMNTSNNVKNNKGKDEAEKLEQMHQKVLQRIEEIKEICTVFS